MTALNLPEVEETCLSSSRGSGLPSFNFGYHLTVLLATKFVFTDLKQQQLYLSLCVTISSQTKTLLDTRTT